jgi:hypothetical protein
MGKLGGVIVFPPENQLLELVRDAAVLPLGELSLPKSVFVDTKTKL